MPRATFLNIQNINEEMSTNQNPLSNSLEINYTNRKVKELEE